MTQEIESIGLSMDTSGVEKGIKSLETLAAAGPKVERAMGGVEGAATRTGKSLESLGQGKAATSLSKIGDAANSTARDMGRVNQASDQVSRGLSGMAANADLAAKAIASIGIAASVQQYLRVADAVTALNNSLKLSTGSVQAASAAYEDLFQIAQRSRVGFLQLGETYSSISRATSELGVSQARMLKVTESIANAMTIGGGSAQSMNAALIQLSQGMASGTLRGEELNSILEQAPRLAKALADGLGVPIGKLREMGAAGEITSQQIVKALESQSAVLSKEVTGATLTLGQAFTQLSNSGTKAVGEFDKASGASTTLAQAISSVATAMDGLGTSFKDNAGTIQTVMGALAGATALTALAAIPRAIAAVTGAITGLAAVLAANPVVLTLLGVGAAVGGGLAAVNAYSKTAEGIKSAVRSLEEANQRSEAAMQRAMDGGRSAGADNIRKTIEERKKAIRDLNAELALMSNTSLDNRAEEARLAAGTEQYRAQQRAAEELAGIKQKLSGVDKDYLPTLNKLFRQYQDGNITLKEYQALVGKLAADNYKPEKKAEGVKEEQSAYASLVATIKAKIAENNAEINSSFKLSESDKLRIKLMEELNSGAKTLTASHKARALALLDVLSAQEKEEARIKSLVAAYKQEQETAEEIAAAYVAQSKAREDGRAAVSAYANGIDESAKALQLELSLMGQSEQSRAVALEQYRIELDLKKQIAAIDANTGFNEREREEERARARAAAAIATANASSRAFLEEWKQSVSTYDDIFRRGFADMLNNGKDGWKSFTKSLATTFKTTVADQIYKMFAQPFVVNIVGNMLGLLGGGATAAVGGAAAAASGGSALSTVGGIGSAISAGTSAFGIGASYGFQSLFANGLTGTLAAGGQMIGAGSIASGLGTIAGALGPIALGVGALMAIAKATKGETRTGGQFGVAFDGSVTNQRRGQTYTIEGQQFDRDFTNGLQTALKDGIAYRLEGDPVAQESAIREAVAGTASGINGFLKALGSAATLTGFSAGLETSGKGRGGVFAGGLLSTGQGFGESGKGDNYSGTLYEAFSTNSPDFKTALENFTLDLKQATIQALQTVSDIPQAVQKLLKGVDAEGLTEDAANKLLETINAQIVGVNQFKDALKGMGLDTLAALSFDAAAGLAEVSGGFDKLLGNLQTYYTNFFTGEEQRANLQRSLAQQLSTLGLQLPDINASNARDQFRALVSAAEKDMSEAGRKTYATLLALSGAFASITEAAATTTQTLEQQRQAYYGALQDAVSARNKSLQNQLSAAQEVASALGDVFDTLRSNVRELYGEVDGTRGMLAAQGNSFIDQALATAKSSGYLPDPEKLAEAISSARGGLDGGAYTTQFAADRDRLVLAGKLSGLQEIAGKQLTDAQKTVRALETQIEQNEQTLDYWKQQIDIASGTYQGILSVESAIQQLSGFLGGTGSTRPTAATGSLGGDISGPAYRDRGTVARADYGADVALSSFDKFKAWYQGLATNANVGALQSAGYQVPDWMRVGGMAGDSTDKELFGSYLYFKNNPQFAKDFEQVMTTGRSSLPTDGSTLVRSDLSKMPADVAAYFQSDRNSLLSYESFGLDPVLAYKLYKDGPEQFGLNLSRENFTEWLRTHKWTDTGVVSSNNTLDTAKGYAGYNLARYDTGTGNIVNLDGSIYSPDGKYLGMAGRDLMASVYGSAFLGTSGGSYGDATRSALYNSQVQGGATEADYYGAIKTNLDAAISGGMSAQGIADAITQTGASMADVAAAYGITVAQLEENLRAGGATNIPKFDIGTNYVPRDMLAYIHEGEAVVPKAYNPAAGGGGAGGNAELVAEVRALREAVAALQAAASETAGNTRLMPQMGRQFDQVAGTGLVFVKAA